MFDYPTAYTATYKPSPAPKVPWEQWFAWHPVLVHGKRKWMTTVWRKVVMIREDTHLYARYKYGNMFDVIKDEE